MESSAPGRSPAAPPTRRARWLWAVVLGALTLWLAILLMTSGERAPAQPPQRGASPAAQRVNPGLAAALSKRRDVRVAPLSTPVPMRVDQGHRP